MQQKIIQFLKNAEEHISGEELSRKLKISRAGIWKYIEELRKEGYDIVASPHLGYKLVSTPDKFFPHEIKSALQTKLIGQEILYFDHTESTMDVAFKAGVEDAKEGTVVIAESQQKGRGRMGRSWVSPKGKGIYLSVILRPKLSPTDVAKLTLLSAVCLCETIGTKYHLKPEIKWPNDVLIDGKKVAGILTELSAEMDRVRFVVVGVGINANTLRKNLPDNATSLKNELGESISRVELLQDFLKRLEGWYDKVQRDGFDDLFVRWRELSSTIGQQVKLEDSYGCVEGEAIDLDEFGGLVIRDKHGTKIKRMSGDVIYV